MKLVLGEQSLNTHNKLVPLVHIWGPPLHSPSTSPSPFQFFLDLALHIVQNIHTQSIIDYLYTT